MRCHLFIDIAPSDLYITFISYKCFSFDDGKTKKGNLKGTLNYFQKPQNFHCRAKDNSNLRANGAGYKADFTLKQLIKNK